MLILLACLVPGAYSAQALTAVPYTPPVQTAASVIVTGYGFNGRNVLYVQLFNKSDDLVSLDGWNLQYRLGQSVQYASLVQLEGLLKPFSFVLAADTDAISGAEYPYHSFVADDEPLPDSVTLRLMPPEQYKPEEMRPLVGGIPSFLQRNISESTGNYLSTFSSFTPADDHTLFAGGLYDYPETTGLKVVEILANPRDCSPIELSMDCHDYIKFFNPTDSTIDLSNFRLRSGYQQQTATSSNTFYLGGLLEPGHYATLTTSDDGADVTLVNTGGYIWVEDIFGVKVYDSSVQNYPSASSETHKGQSWAYDALNDKWAWSSRPTPEDAPNVFPVAVVALEEAESDDRVPCNANQYRSAETGRCRLLAVASSDVLVPCPPGEYRNESTNRCRSLVVTTGLTPCEPGEERNPATNRCRKIAAEKDTTLVPCKDNQERNPDTNRCRNKPTASLPSKVAFPVERAAQGASDFVGWWALGLVIFFGVSYGIWEWRYELRTAFGRIFRRAG